MKVVWILGAGFSMPLGGPGLLDLFALPMRERLLSAFSIDDDWVGARASQGHFEELIRKFSAAVQRTFSLYGWENVERKDRLKPRWRDAEHCLDFVERGYAAGLHGDLGRYLERHGWKKGGEDLTALRRVLAAACHTFIPSARRSELWDVYREWAHSLTGDDTVLTFNYDALVEELAGEHVQVFLPVNRQGDSQVVEVPPAEGKPVLFKLHGSVDWENCDDHVVKREARLLCLGYRNDPNVPNAPKIAIASPGPSKALLTDSLFKKVWEHAVARLADADRVVIIGYRFPETDAIALRRILGAIGAPSNGGKRAKHPTVITVLGDNVDVPQSRRLRALLVETLRRNSAGKEPQVHYQMPAESSGRNVVQLPYWAQDYLTLGAPGLRSSPASSKRASRAKRRTRNPPQTIPGGVGSDLGEQGGTR